MRSTLPILTIFILLLATTLQVSSYYSSQVTTIKPDTSHQLTSDFIYEDNINDRSAILPTGPDYAWGGKDEGLMDLHTFEVLSNDSHVQFQFVLGELTNPYDTSLDYSLTFVSLYIDHKAGGTNTTVASEEATTYGLWDTAMLGDGFNYRVYFSNNTDSPTSNPTGFTSYGDLSADMIVFSLPLDVLGSQPTSSWEYYVLVGAEYYGNFYEISEENGSWQIGGGIEERYDPDIIDMAIPPSQSNTLQDDLLQNYNEDNPAIVYPIGPDITTSPTDIKDQIIPTMINQFNGFATSYGNSFLYETTTSTRNININSTFDDSGIFTSGIAQLVVSANGSQIYSHEISDVLNYEYNYSITVSLGMQEVNITVVDAAGNSNHELFWIYLSDSYEEDIYSPSFSMNATYNGTEVPNNSVLVVPDDVSIFLIRLDFQINETATNELSELNSLVIVYEDGLNYTRELSGFHQKVVFDIVAVAGRTLSFDIRISDVFGNTVVKSFTVEVIRETSSVTSTTTVTDSSKLDSSNQESEDTLTSIDSVTLSWSLIMISLCILPVLRYRKSVNL